MKVAPNSLLFVLVEGLGDSIMNLPMLQTLAADHAVQVLCHNRSTAALLRVAGFQPHDAQSKWELFKTARSCAVETLFIPFPTWKKELAVALGSRARRRFLFSSVEYPWARGLWKFTAEPDPARHTIENSLALLRQMERYRDRDPATILDLQWLLRAAVRPEKRGRSLVIHPTGSVAAKFYPVEFWQDLAPLLAPNFDEIHIVCGSSAAEMAYCQTLAAAFSGRAQLSAGLAFPELIGRLALADFFIGSESGLLHLSAMLDKPVLGLWCHGDIRTYHPYGNDVKVYLPREIRDAPLEKYPEGPPPYLRRASGAQVAEIIRGTVAADFSLQPLFKKAVEFFLF